MEYLNICTKKTYEQNGETKTKWLNCGTLRITEDGKMFIELNQSPDTTLFVFKPKPKTSEQPSGAGGPMDDSPEIPF